MIMSPEPIHPVDQVLPVGHMLAVGLQHVFVMYAGAIAMPLIFGGALKLPSLTADGLGTITGGVFNTFRIHRFRKMSGSSE
jgi:xanthine/uracil permease